MAVRSIIVCLTDVNDAHLPYVVPHLRSEFIVVHGLPAEDNGHLAYSCTAGATTVSQDDKLLTNVKSVWYRKPKIKQACMTHVERNYRRYAQSALKNHLDFIYPLLHDAFWISDYYAIMRAGSKPLQLRKAAALGFHIPDTLETSDRRQAIKFLAHHKEIVVKSPSAWGLEVDNDLMLFPTTLIKHGQKLNLRGLHLAPAIFQQAIKPALDLRITVVGDKVFAASIKDRHASGVPASVRDWRFNYSREEILFGGYDLEDNIASRCVRLVKSLGLQYGAIDLVVDKKGKTWFLEINPNGQWAFIEDDTGLPIGKAIAELLERGNLVN